MATQPVSNYEDVISMWEPILPSGSKIAEQAWESIRAISDSLVARDYTPGSQYALRDSHYEESLLYGYLALTHNDLIWANRTTECLNFAIEKASGRSEYLGLFGGVAGLGWIVEHLSRVLQQVSANQSEVDASAEDETEELIVGQVEIEEEVDLNSDVDAAILCNLPRVSPETPYDLISGLVGFGVYFLERLPKPSAVDGIRGVIDQLEAIAQRTDQGITWYSGPDLLPEWQRKLCPNGYYNLGVAHGIPGVIHFLSEVYAANMPESDRAYKLLESSMNWFLAQVRPAGSASRFSAWLIPGEDSSDSRMAWCYGDLGILSVLLQVARRTNRSDWRRFANEVLDHCLAWPEDKTGVADAPLCHGAVGVAHIFNRIYQQEGDKRCRDAAVQWYERAMAMRQPGSGIGGYFTLTRPVPSEPIVWEASPAFLDGASGVALALLAAVTPVEPEWDRMLLISGKH
jgi:lantibiotic biosynthesis protein